MTTIAIRGGGMAAQCSANLLARAGFRVSLERTDRPKLPAILLNDASLALIRDIFNRPAAFNDASKIRKRIVAWGNTEPLILDHSAVVVSEQLLVESLEESFQNQDAEPDWTIFASRPLPEAVREQRFGSRIASAVHVDLREGCDSSACWIESVEEGWLFLIPNSAEAGWLLAVGAPAGTLLGHSRVIAKEIARLNRSGEFPAYPRIASPLCASGWLACGTAAIAFDPICGDGTAQAVREAILAAAVIRAIDNGGDEQELLAHYESRLNAGFHRHLTLCRQFYKSGHGGPWWDAELEALERGLESLARDAAGRGEFRYKLDGFELKRVI